MAFGKGTRARRGGNSVPAVFWTCHAQKSLDSVGKQRQSAQNTCFSPGNRSAKTPGGGGRSYFAPAKSAKSNQTRGTPTLIRFCCSARDQFFPAPESARRILGVATEIRLALSGTGKNWSRAEQQEIRKVPVNPVWKFRAPLKKAVLILSATPEAIF